LPRHILGRFTALCAFVRMIYLAFVVGVLSALAPSQSWDLTFCDGVSAMIPILRLFCLPVSTIHLSDKTCYFFLSIYFVWFLLVSPQGLPSLTTPRSSIGASCLQVLFYCHYPDKLLCTDRRSLFKRLYRAPLDWLEEITTGTAPLLL
jgi:alpha-1,3/alpha-1,6-mannosyltransferase